jgi:hypothetical protein
MPEDMKYRDSWFEENMPNTYDRASNLKKKFHTNLGLLGQKFNKTMQTFDEYGPIGGFRENLGMDEDTRPIRDSVDFWKNQWMNAQQQHPVGKMTKWLKDRFEENATDYKLEGEDNPPWGPGPSPWGPGSSPWRSDDAGDQIFVGGPQLPEDLRDEGDRIEREVMEDFWS